MKTEGSNHDPVVEFYSAFFHLSFFLYYFFCSAFKLNLCLLVHILLCQACQQRGRDIRSAIENKCLVSCWVIGFQLTWTYFRFILCVVLVVINNTHRNHQFCCCCCSSISFPRGDREREKSSSGKMIINEWRPKES